MKAVLADTVALLCKNGLSYERELKIQAVIGVTVDENDVFIVHINEAFNAQGASSTSVGETSSSSMTVVPFGHQPKSEPVTPSSGVKRMRAESLSSAMSPSGDAARPPHAKQQLRFPSPAKTATAPRLPGSPSLSGGVNPAVPHSGGVSRGMMAARRGMMRGARRGASALGRGGFPPAARGLRGMARGGRATAASGGCPGVRGSGRGIGRGRACTSSLPPAATGHDMKLNPGHSMPGAAPPDSSSHPGPSLSSHSTGVVGSYDYNPYLSTAAGPTHQASTSLDDLPAFSTTAGDQGSFPGINSMPSGFGFDSIFAADSSSGGPQAGSFADINPSVEFAFPSSFAGSDAVSGGFARSASGVGLQNATPASAGSDVKTAAFNDDVIYVDDDADAPAAGAGDGEDADGVAGTGVQQITRRVTITTNIQGQNVKYEQVTVRQV